MPICLLLALPGPARATTVLGSPVSLLDLLGGGGLAVDGLLFDAFNYSAAGEMPDAAAIYVTPILDDMGNYGIRFQGPFGDTSSSPGGSDAVIGFDVSVANPAVCLERQQTGCLISDAHLAGDPQVGENSLGSMSVTETLDNQYVMEIYQDSALGTQLTDGLNVEPTTHLSVVKDILGYAIAGSVGLRTIDQTFSVPEPGTLLLLGFGLSGLLVAGRRR